MSTRSITKVILNGSLCVCQYKQSDGYPTYQGVQVLEFMQSILLNGRLEEFKKKLSASLSYIQLGESMERKPSLPIGTLTKQSPLCTYTGAPTTILRDQWINMVHDVRMWIDRSSGKKIYRYRSWKDAVKLLLSDGKISEAQADWLIVAGRDSGVGIRQS